MVCDCGYAFTSGAGDPFQIKMLLERRAKILIRVGIVNLALGLGLTILTLLLASAIGIGFYLVFSGLIIIGLASWIMGMIDKIRIRKFGI